MKANLNDANDRRMLSMRLEVTEVELAGLRGVMALRAIDLLAKPQLKLAAEGHLHRALESALKFARLVLGLSETEATRSILDHMIAAGMTTPEIAERAVHAVTPLQWESMEQLYEHTRLRAAAIEALRRSMYAWFASRPVESARQA